MRGRRERTAAVERVLVRREDLLEERRRRGRVRRGVEALKPHGDLEGALGEELALGAVVDDPHLAAPMTAEAPPDLVVEREQIVVIGRPARRRDRERAVGPGRGKALGVSFATVGASGGEDPPHERAVLGHRRRHRDAEDWQHRPSLRTIRTKPFVPKNPRPANNRARTVCARCTFVRRLRAPFARGGRAPPAHFFLQSSAISSTDAGFTRWTSKPASADSRRSLSRP